MLLYVDGVETDVPVGWEPFTRGHREGEHWTVRLLDRDDKVVGELDGVEGASLTFNVYADTRGSGRLAWSGALDEQIVWRDHRVQPVYRAQLPADDQLSSWHDVEWRAGVYICSTPEDAFTEVDVGVDMQLFDKTLILRRAKLTDTYALDAGTNVVTTLRDLIPLYVTGTAPVIEDSTATLRSPMTWDAGTPILRVVNDLLDAIGYYALWADGDGVLRSSNYQAPSSRPLSWEFGTGATALHMPDFTHTLDDFDTPNRVTLVSRADGDQAALKSTIALDDIDSTHELAFAVTGEWNDYYEDNIEAADQTALDVLAERKLLDGLGTASTYKIEHAPMPLPMNGRVTFTRPDDEVVEAVVQELVFDLDGSDFEARLREVVG